MTYIYYYYDVLDWIHSDHIMEENRRKRETEREVKYRIVKIGLAELQTRTYCNLPSYLLLIHYCDVARTSIMKSIWRAGARCLAKLCTLSWANNVVCAK